MGVSLSLSLKRSFRCKDADDGQTEWFGEDAEYFLIVTVLEQNNLLLFPLSTADEEIWVYEMKLTHTIFIVIYHYIDKSNV